MDGTPFGRYRLIELLGRGGMGEVWRAFDTDTDRIVAIKVLPAHFSDNEDFQQRFRREAHAAARLNTPHVIPIHNYGEIDGRLYVDMRLIEGRDLQAVLADGPLEPSRAVRIIEGVAKALHAAHEVGLVHRDVKPSNVLLDRDDFAYLIDFGIARAAADTRLTRTGGMIGTFQYMAPERFGSRPEDARADIYALACVLYECLTGHPPFEEDSAERLMAAHLNTPPPQPSTTQPNVPEQIDHVIATGMAKNPDDRYATTVELARDARDAITEPIPQRVASVPPPPLTKPAAAAPPPPAASTSAPTEQRPPQEVPTQRREPPAVRPAAPRPPARPTTTRQQKLPSRPPVGPAESTWRRSARIAIGVVLLASGAILTVLTCLGHPECGDYLVGGGCNRHFWHGPLSSWSVFSAWSVFFQPYVQTALVPPLWTAGILVLRRHRWWTYAVVPIAGIFAFLSYMPLHHGHGGLEHAVYFLFWVLFSTVICVLIAWGISRLVALLQGRATSANR